MSEHIVSLKIYVAIFLALMSGTALTVWAGLHDFPGQLNVIIALTIAVIKATLVVLPLPMRLGSIEEFANQTRARMANAQVDTTSK